jgi:hypothetical protein
VDIWIFYLAACIPAAIGFALQFISKRVNVWEWMIGTAVGFLTVGIFHFTAIRAMTGDVQTVSGHVTSATHHPWWKERYTVVVTHSSGSGKHRRTWTTTETRYRDHPEHWTCNTSLGGLIDINVAKFEVFRAAFRNLDTVEGSRSGICAGDRHDYVTTDRRNDMAKVFPITEHRVWTNRVKASTSLFSYAPVPEDVDKALPNWPSNPNPFESNRVIGDCKVDRTEWDRMNSRLGPKKLVNVIIVGLGKQPMSVAKWLESKWIGGKKNDLVLCYGTDSTGKATWACVFGWTESELVKRNLETILLSGPSLPAIESEIAKNYRIKDWSKFDYLRLEPPLWSFWVLVVVMVLVQGGWYYFASNNDWEDEDEGERKMYRSSYYPNQRFRQ